MGIVKRDSILITIISFVGVIIGFVNKILLFPNFLSEEQVGLTSILLDIAVMFAQFSALGVTSSIIRFFPFFKTADRRHNGLFFWSALIVSIGFILFSILFLLFKEPVRGYFEAQSPLLSQYYLLVIPLALATLVYNFYNTWLQALSRTVISSGVYDVGLRLAITLTISLYALKVIDFEQFLGIYILVHFVPTLALVIYTAAIGESYAKPVITPSIKRLLTLFVAYGAWQFFGSVSYFLVPIIDKVMLAGMVGLAQSGVYAIMLYMVTTLLIPYRSIIKVATPLVSQYWKNRDMGGMQRLYRDVSLTNLIVGCGLFLLIWVNLGNIFTLIPDSYSLGRYVFLFLSIGRIVDVYSGLNGMILVTSKRYRYDLYFSVMLVVVTVVANIIFIPIWGMNGAAAATMLALVLQNVVRVGFVWKFYGIHPFSWNDGGVVILAVGIALVNQLVPQMGSFYIDSAVRTVVVVAIFGGTIYVSNISEQINGMVDKLLGRSGRG